jgi:preprotein translocase subunit SecB
MTETFGDIGDNGQGDEMESMPLIVKAQYIKDLSFENPGAPGLLAEIETEPTIEINVNVQVQKLGTGDFEVSLMLNADAKSNGQQVFIAELEYAGIFELGPEVPEEHQSAVLLIECPRLLFPFARNILADATREGGLPPLMLQPIDFVAIYQQQMGQEGARLDS